MEERKTYACRIIIRKKLLTRYLTKNNGWQEIDTHMYILYSVYIYIYRE